MRVHRQTQRRLVDDDAVREVLRRRMRCGLPTDAKTMRNLGIACGSCRHSRLRREVERELAAAMQTPPVTAPSAANGDLAVRATGAPASGIGVATPFQERSAVAETPPSVSVTRAVLGRVGRAVGVLVTLIGRRIARRWWPSLRSTAAAER